MKYTILGFNQQKAVELGLGVDDLLIIRWFVDFYSSSKMVKMNVGEKTYVWVNYSKVVEDVPILNMKKDTLYRHLKKICEAGIMEHETIKQGGVFSLYRLADTYDMLIGSDLNPRGTDKNPEPYGKKSVTHTDKNLEQNINLLNNYSIKDKYIYSPKEKESVSSTISAYTENQDLQDALKDFSEMRTKIKKPLTVRAMKLALKELDKLAVDDFTKTDIVNQSIVHGWQTFYALQNKGKEKTREEMGYAF